MARPRRWHVHLGAHKTATTQIQDSLVLNRSALAGHGVGVVSRADIRSVNFPIGKAFHRFFPGVGMQIRRHMGDKGAGQPTVVLSEELILGLAPEMLLSPMYPNAAERLRPLARLARKEPVSFFLGVRGHDSIFPSCYAQALRARAYPPGHFDVIRQQLQQQPPSWMELARRLSQALGGAQLTVWTMEAYKENPQRILSELTGVDGLELAEVTSNILSPSAEAVAEVENTCADLVRQERQEAVARIYTDLSPGHPKFAPFTAEEVSALKQAYQQDLEQMAAAGFIRLLKGQKDG